MGIFTWQNYEWAQIENQLTSQGIIFAFWLHADYLRTNVTFLSNSDVDISDKYFQSHKIQQQ